MSRRFDCEMPRRRRRRRTYSGLVDLWDLNRTAYGTAEIVLLVDLLFGLEKAARVESVVANVLIQRTVQVVASRL